MSVKRNLINVGGHFGPGKGGGKLKITLRNIHVFKSIEDKSRDVSDYGLSRQSRTHHNFKQCCGFFSHLARFDT